VVGIQERSADSSVICAVRIARLSSEVCRTSGSRSCSRSSSPARMPSARPLSVSGTSTHPVNRFFWFHSLSPWRRSTRLYVMRSFWHAGARRFRVRLIVGTQVGERPDEFVVIARDQVLERREVAGRLAAGDPPRPLALHAREEPQRQEV